jgi:PadR family transcriptional regulator AphA
MFKENKSRYAILGLLSVGPMSGYKLKKTIEISISNFWNESYGQIYPILKQLEREGLTTSRVETQEGRPDSYVHTLTDKGWGELRRWLREAGEDNTNPTRNEMLLKLFFTGRTDVAVSIEHVRKFRAVQEDVLQHYDDTEAIINAMDGSSPDVPYWLMTLSFGRHITQSMVDWSDETLAALERIATEKAPTEVPL